MSQRTSAPDEIDDPARIAELRACIGRKGALRRWYADAYGRFAACLARCPAEGLVVELGAGGGFLKETIPEALATDVLPYAGIDRVVDATRMDFEPRSVRLVCMLNVFHHVPDAEAFFGELQRCLVPGGRVLMIDQHAGWISTRILKWMHHEPFDERAAEWAFESSGPLSGANGALTWIVFRRDRALFERRFPRLRVVSYRPNSPLRYWLAGGLKPWSLLPGPLYGAAAAVDDLLVRAAPELGSFVDVELLLTE